MASLREFDFASAEVAAVSGGTSWLFRVTQAGLFLLCVVSVG